MCDAQMMPPIMGGSPGVVDKQVGAGSNDGRRYTGGGGFSATDSPCFFAGYINNGAYYHMHSFYCWEGVTMSGTITASYMRFNMNGNRSGEPVVRIYGVDEEDAAPPTTAGEFDADPLTDESVPWSTGWVNSDWNESPSLNALIQELVDTHTFDNDRLMLQMKNDGGTTERYLRIYSFEGASGLAAEIHIEYTVGAQTYYQSVAGVLSFAGALDPTATFHQSLVGTLSFAGALSKKTSKSMGGVLSFAGDLKKKTTKMLSGTLSFTGALSTSLLLVKSVAGTLSFVGSLVAQKVTDVRKWFLTRLGWL